MQMDWAVHAFLLILLSSLFVLLFRRLKIAMIPLLLSYWVMVWYVWENCRSVSGGQLLHSMIWLQTLCMFEDWRRSFSEGISWYSSDHKPHYNKFCGCSFAWLKQKSWRCHHSARMPPGSPLCVQSSSITSVWVFDSVAVYTSISM